MKVFDGVRELRLGSKLGAGADGAVYRAEGNRKVCIKVFDPGTRAELQRNLPRITLLVQRANALVRDAAIPMLFVSDRPNGPPIGFAMQMVEGKEVHNLYGVSSRQIHFPTADFRFLVQVAKNAAVAADRLHANRIVIGDISGRNLMVRSDATVCWIDADSFLIGNPDYREIGRLVTPEWTPPELQGNRHLNTPRLPGHDRFGLAVLIFHILMLGRHPFQGRFTGRGEVPDLQSNISQRWYAHAGFNAIPLQPPIGTPPVSHLGPRIADLFHMAFLENVPERRPSAADWVEALKSLEANYRRCQRYTGHYFAAAATGCPWCQVLPDYGNLDLFPGAATPHANGGTNAAGATQLAAEVAGFIHQLGAPRDIANTVFRPTQGQAVPTWTYRSPGWFASIFTSKASEQRKLVHIRTGFERQAGTLQNQITRNLQKQQTWLNALGGTSRRFAELQAEAGRKLGEAALRQSARMQLEGPILNQQRAIFLARFRIKPGQISGFGEKRVAELAGHGIVTAADVSDYRIKRIPGFGESLTAAIVAWRSGKERSFRPTTVNVPPADVERRARELLAQLKPEFQKRRELLIREVFRLTNDARTCAGEAATIQQQLDVVMANIAAIDQALNNLG